MRNVNGAPIPNSSEKTQDAETGPWNSMGGTNEAMDKFDREVAQDAVKAREDHEAKKAQLSKMRDELAGLAQSSKIYHVDGLDVREKFYDTSRAEQQVTQARREAKEAEERFESFSTAEGRQAMADEKREEAAREAERSRYLQAGLHNQNIAYELRELSERLAETTDADARKAIEKKLAEKEEIAIMAGKAYLEGEVQTTDAEERGLDGVSEDERQEDDAKETVVERRILADNERARNFAEKITDEALRSMGLEECLKLQKLLRRVEKSDPSQGRLSLVDGWQRKKDLSELRRYGYNPS